MGRDDHLRDVQRLGHLGGVQRTGAPEGHQRELAWIVSLLDRPRPDRAGHVGVGDRDRALGGLGEVEAELLGQPRNRGLRPRPHPTACARRGTARRRCRPSTTWASVTVGCCRRGRSRPDPASAPALRGPTRNPPAGSTNAIEPPPAPIVCTSSIGTSSGYPPTHVSRAEASPIPCSVTIPMSADVPPMSNVISRRRSASAPAHCPPRTPAAGPDSSRVTGRSAALCTLARPPLDIITWRSRRTPSRSGPLRAAPGTARSSARRRRSCTRS